MGPTSLPNIKPFNWDVFLFTSQVSLVFVVVCVSLLNLTFQWGSSNLWMAILTSSLAYIMPNPKLKAANTSGKLTEATSTSSEKI